MAGPVRYVAKKKLLPFYQEAKEHRPEQWHTWGVSPAEEALLVRTLQVKPRRTASGVATVTVLTKPWPCSSACLYCPNDVRMPKSYLHDEPACQRAERNWFDPYLQVTARLRTLHQMGHVTDKVELIVLGGTWSDYPEAYQIWYMHELFRALNDMGCEATVERESETRRTQYRDAGIACERDDLANWAAEAQARVTAGDASYNETVRSLYACGIRADNALLHSRSTDRNAASIDAPLCSAAADDTQGAAFEPFALDNLQGSASDNGWAAAAQWQTATFSQLEALQRENEAAEHRCVGLVVETRPDAVTPKRLATLRRLGCTKLQMGIQSLDERILAANHRGIGVDRMQQAFELARIFGFKTHAHFMTNLLGATPESDAADYRRMVEHPAFKPDEIKLYPCALVDGTGLVAHWRDGSWRPYTEQELVNLLAEDVLVTPPFTRISRMIRDISAHDIMTGNKKVNLRQLVDLELAKRAQPVQEIRSPRNRLRSCRKRRALALRNRLRNHEHPRGVPAVGRSRQPHRRLPASIHAERRLCQRARYRPAHQCRRGHDPRGARIRTRCRPAPRRRERPAPRPRPHAHRASLRYRPRKRLHRHKCDQRHRHTRLLPQARLHRQRAVSATQPIRRKAGIDAFVLQDRRP